MRNEGGWDQDSSSGSDERKGNDGHILKVEAIGLSEKLYVRCERSQG